MKFEIDFKKALEDKPRHPGWGLSQVGSCIRKLTFLDAGADTSKFPANVQRLFTLGNKLEDQMAEEIGKRGFPIKERQGWVEIGGRRGRIDGIIQADIGDLIWECKSMNARAFSYLVKANSIELKQWQYYMQAVAYLYGIRELKVYNPVGVYFTVQNKDKSTIFQEFVVVPEEHIEWVVNRVEEVNILRDNKELAPVPKEMKEKKNKWQCQYCNVKSSCFKCFRENINDYKEGQDWTS